LLAPKLDTL
jgi:hypothetical protein